MSDYIPEDVMIQILEHLPADSLFRFWRVCKWMNDFIDSPSFIQRHLALQKPRFISLYRGREFLVVNPHTPFIVSAPLARRSESQRVSLVGTLHGIVCFYYSNSHFLLCNLSIRKSLMLPMPDFKRPAFAYYASRYPFNYDEPHEEYDEDYDGFHAHSGFWISASTKDFKIVTFFLGDISPSAVKNAVLYSSIEQDWKPLVKQKVCMYTRLSDTPAVIIRKVGYWRIWGVNLDGNEDEDGNALFEARIASFDFVKEEFGMFGCPELEYILVQRDSPPVLSRWRDTLSLVYVNDENHYDVYFWQGRDDWVRMLTLNLLQVTNITKFISVAEYEGKDSDSAEELLDNRRILANTLSDELVLCDNGPAYVASKGGFENDEFTFSVAYDYVGSLLFPQG